MNQKRLLGSGLFVFAAAALIWSLRGCVTVVVRNVDRAPRRSPVVAVDKKGRSPLASYILHPPMSQEKMTDDPQTGTVPYRNKKVKGPEVIQMFSAQDG
ncbi:MAG: hypothetical protein HYR55_08190 [Acidobacteria bacterium]|nr:hypothetical protein [Acidobacteriota bacterium]MBI3656564.1 hypothetical protein [Acidobacteriota bacterium]